MLIILPNEIDGLPALQEKLKDPAALETAIDNMYNVDVNVYLPKFKIETQIDLIEVLSSVSIKAEIIFVCKNLFFFNIYRRCPIA